MASAVTMHLPKPEDSANFISVSDPVQHSEGMNKYTAYRVEVCQAKRPESQEILNEQPTDGPTSSTDPNSSPPPPPNDMYPMAGTTAVLRRYSDFLWLYERLQKERAGAIVPPLPSKQAVSRFSAAFIEERRSKLEQFLRRVAVHPELYDAPCLDVFLKADDITFHTAKNAKGSSQDTMLMMSSMNQSSMNMMHQSMTVPPVMPTPPKAKKDKVKKWFNETKTSISGDLVRSPDDDLFEEIDRYIDGLEKQMKNVQTQASGLVKKGREVSNGLFEFGLAFNVLGQSEADALGGALSQMGQTADGLSVVSAEHAEKEMAQFEEPIKDYVKTIQAVKQALQRRHEKRLTYTTHLSEVNTKRTNLAKLRAMPGAEAKAFGAEMSLKRGEQKVEIAREEFAVVSQRVLREVDRFKREKAEAMKRTVLDYITLQIDYNKKMEQAWATLLPRLESVQTSNDVLSAGHGNGMAPQMGTEITVHPAEQQSTQPNSYDLNEPQNTMLEVGGAVQYRDNSVGFTM